MERDKTWINSYCRSTSAERTLNAAVASWPKQFWQIKLFRNLCFPPKKLSVAYLFENTLKKGFFRFVISTSSFHFNRAKSYIFSTISFLLLPLFRFLLFFSVVHSRSLARPALDFHQLPTRPPPVGVTNVTIPAPVPGIIMIPTITFRSSKVSPQTGPELVGSWVWCKDFKSGCSNFLFSLSLFSSRLLCFSQFLVSCGWN